MIRPFRIRCRNRDLMARLAEFTAEPTDTAAVVAVLTPKGNAAVDELRRDDLHLLAAVVAVVQRTN